MRKDFVLLKDDTERISVSTFGNSNQSGSPCIILVHGFKGFKDWGFFPYTAEYFSKQGFFVLTFNFSHNGIGSNETEFTELDLFAKNTFSREVSELEFIIQSLLSGKSGLPQKTNIILIGHSRGGAIAALTAGKFNEVSCLVLWASVCKLDRYTNRQKTEWKKDGKIDVLNTRTKQILSLNVSLLEDIEKNSSGSLNIQNSVASFHKPLLIVHGDQDVTVPVKEAYQLFDWADKSSTSICIIEGTGHTFHVQHPFEGLNDKFERVLEKTNNFIKKNLN
ncbi:MAG: alpha/beta fold hydrolase [Ignavibacteriales bacterium]|nr:MAG: alpha/beta fold hydrolase [Ignavibacteriales bacterium]